MKFRKQRKVLKNTSFFKTFFFPQELLEGKNGFSIFLSNATSRSIISLYIILAYATLYPGYYNINSFFNLCFQNT